MKNIYITIYTKEKGKLELTKEQWWDFDLSSLTYHREDGPAIEYSNGDKLCWFINDEEYYSKADYNRLLEEVDSLEPILGLIDPRDWVRKRFERKYKKAI